MKRSRGAATTELGKRAKEARARIAPLVPVLVSLATLEATTGIPRRRWRDALARCPSIPRAKLGKDTLLTPEGVRELFEALTIAGATTNPVLPMRGLIANDAPDDEADEDEDEDAILAGLGYRAAPAR